MDVISLGVIFGVAVLLVVLVMMAEPNRVR